MGKNKHQILVIDDDPNIRMLLDFLLRKNYQVVTRENGLQGLSWISEGNLPDLIILDVDMPEINGYEFLCRIRESGLYRDIPVIMLTGYEEAEIKTKCLEKGLSEYLLKPFNPEEVIQAIERQLNNDVETPIQT